MKIKLNYDLLTYKKGTIIDIDKIPYKDKQFFIRRIKDSKIDNCVEEVLNIQLSKDNKKAKKEI